MTICVIDIIGRITGVITYGFPVPVAAILNTIRGGIVFTYSTP